MARRRLFKGGVGAGRSVLVGAALLSALLVLALAEPLPAGALVVHDAHGTFFGIAPRAGATPRGAARSGAAQRGSSRLAGPSRNDANGLLDYNGGPVLHSSTAYAIFWDPANAYPVSTMNDISQYFRDVAADSGKATNVYSVAAQYTDAGGRASYQVSYGATLTDTTAYPASGCKDPNVQASPAPCITDSQLQAELTTFIAAHGLPSSGNAIYFVFFPPGVNTCQDATAGQCSTNVYCAYHTGTSGSFLYTNEPWQNDKSCQRDGNAAVQQPNGEASDVILKIASHEHNETTTDPYGNGWFDTSTGDENGDKCHGVDKDPNSFVPTLGGDVGGTLYNQRISGHNYYLQSEWSNLDAACRMQGDPPPSNTAPPAISGSAVQGQTLTEAHGSWSNSPTAFAYLWVLCDASGSACSPIGGATGQTYALRAADVGHAIRVIETAANASDAGGPASSAQTSAVVPPPPANSAPPAISGRLVQGQTLTESHGSWSNSPTAFAYLWEGCDASGNGCAPIAGATGQTHTLVPADLGHAIRVVESASNAGGSSGPASSAASGAVPATAAQIKALLLTQITPTGRGAGIAGILKAGGYTLAFGALSAGTARVDWYYLPPGARIAKRRPKPRPLLLARGTMTFTAIGSGKLNLRLTAAGRRLLRREKSKHAKQLNLTATASFAPPGNAPLLIKRAFSLKR